MQRRGRRLLFVQSSRDRVFRAVASVVSAVAVAFLAVGCGGSGGAGADSGLDAGASDAGTIEGRVPPGGWAALDCDEPLWGTWATVDVSDRGILPGTGDVSAALQDLIDGLGEATVLSFPAGTYGVNDVTIDKSNVIIRGAGPQQTVFEITTGARAFTLSGNESGDPVQVTSDVPPGSRVVPVADTSEFAVGDVVMVVEDLDRWSFPSAQRGRGGIFVIEDVNEFDSEITLDFPLAVGLTDVGTNGKNATVARLDPVQKVGIEDVRIEHRGTEGSILYLSRVFDGFVRNVQTFNTTQHHVAVSRSHGVVICHSLFEEAQNKGGGGYGYGILLDSLTTNSLVSDNILKDLRHQIALQVGANYNVVSYNFIVDSVRDVCLAGSPPSGCSEAAWIQDGSQNGVADGVLESDLVVHGNYPHHNLIEGNVFYVGILDYVHYENGPGHFFFRNRILGQPDPFGGWLEAVGIWIDGPSDGQTVVGNHFANGSSVSLDPHDGPVPPEDVFIGANILGGLVQWGPIEDGTSLPYSLYLDQRPGFWPQNLPWPPFGPGIVDSETNRIPAQIRYQNP